MPSPVCDGMAQAMIWGEAEKMKTRKHNAYLIWPVIGCLLATLFTGCSSTREFVNTYADQALNPEDISRVALVVDDNRVTEKHNLLFADTFLKTARAKKHLRLTRDNYILKDTLSKSGVSKDTDAYLEIALTHCYAGNQSDHFPTSVGAVAKLVDTKTHKTLWHINYAYASPKGGASAPPVEEAMHRVAGKILEAVPLAPEKPMYAAYTLDSKVKADILPPAPKKVVKNADSQQPLKTRFSDADGKKTVAAVGEPKGIAPPTPRHPAGAFMIHVASVKNRNLAEQFIDRQPADGTVRLSTVVQLNPEKPWYRLLVGRFQTLDEARRHVQAMQQKGRSGAYAKPMKLPFSLLVSSDRPLEPSRKIVEALRKIDYMAYLSPSARAAKTFDVLVGAYESRKEADARAQLLVSNGIPVEVISP